MDDEPSSPENQNTPRPRFEPWYRKPAIILSYGLSFFLVGHTVEPFVEALAPKKVKNEYVQEITTEARDTRKHLFQTLEEVKEKANEAEEEIRTLHFGEFRPTAPITPTPSASR